VIDCDPGHDDAVAILYAARHLDSWASPRFTATTRRQRHPQHALAADPGKARHPVAKGCADPLIGRKGESINAHGKTGLDGTDLPEPDRAALDVHAVDFLIETAREHKGELVWPSWAPRPTSRLR
jgi:inosine-uridine nucleoside N-ribohydrolase